MRAVWGLIGMLLLAGCSGASGPAEASAAAAAFVAASPAQACLLLAPRTAAALERDGGCAQRLAELDLPASSQVLSVEVAGRSAQVRFAGPTMFLARFAEGWRITAAGCRRSDPDPEIPYDCEVEQ